MEQLQSHIWQTASSYTGKYLRISSYIRKPVIYDFATPPLWIATYTVCGKFDFLFYQCALLYLSLFASRYYSFISQIDFWKTVPLFIKYTEGSVINSTHSAFYTLAHAFFYHTCTCKKYVTIHLHKRTHMWCPNALCFVMSK